MFDRDAANFDQYMIQALKHGIDPQAMNLYSAEDDVFFPEKSPDELRRRKPALSVSEALALWDRVHTSPLAIERWPAFAKAPLPRIRFVKIGQPVTSADDLMSEAETGRTSIDTRTVYYQNSGSGMQYSNILHEMGHIILLDAVGFEAFTTGRVEGHGVEFAEIYLTLVKNFLPEKAPLLEKSFKKHHVKFHGEMA